MGGASYVAARRRMVEELVARGYLRDSKVAEAMLTVPRELFVPDAYRHLAYDDRPLPIGEGQSISAPSIVARMTELLDVQEGSKVLEIGTGSGYQAAVLAALVGERGHVWTVERVKGLAEAAEARLRSLELLGRVTVIVGDGTLGYPATAPFDRILVTAAAPSVPQPLVEQLGPGGRLVVPVGSKEEQVLLVVTKEGGELKTARDLEVMFVPLIGKYGRPE
mgnify:CR=1 FL=1